MSGLGVDYPFVLLFLVLALAPFARSALRPSSISSLTAAPPDLLSRVLDSGLTTCGVIAIAASLLGASRPFLAGAEIERIGEGAQIAILIDRSGSMNETFAGKTPAGGEESKTAASKTILRRFVDDRHHDIIGVAAFSTQPMLVTPLSDHLAATKAAIDAIDRPGLDYTNIGRGLAMALAMVKAGEADRSRAVLLVSDGAGVIDPKLQDDLRADLAKMNVNLYWLFLRTAGSPSIYDRPEGDDTPQAAPERHLDLFFKSLNTPYRAFEAESPEATQEALRQIDRLERRPVRYFEKEPRTEMSAAFILLGLFAACLLLAAKFAEIRLVPGKAKP
ncbi:vWA domain-containing protein [Methylocapsa palsarum]|uniref:MxaC protein n=1 Tax=Methylocapsa palsarum TaxID=1612308 RepID=A0A1I4AWT5_9HYPH|nr:vWA domain-containing protein [Methylocapsa palsarum]SFK61038.1 mxaC protein [Methylocapsa palsarum]